MLVFLEILHLNSVPCQIFLAVGICAQADQNCLGFSRLLVVPSFLTFLVLCLLQVAPYFIQWSLSAHWCLLQPPAL